MIPKYHNSISVVIGGRSGVTLMVRYHYEDLGSTTEVLGVHIAHVGHATIA